MRVRQRILCFLFIDTISSLLLIKPIVAKLRVLLSYLSDIYRELTQILYFQPSDPWLKEGHLANRDQHLHKWLVLEPLELATLRSELPRHLQLQSWSHRVNLLNPYEDTPF